MIRVNNLKKSFGDNKLLQGVSYHFPEGERIALVGANGAGKTTLLNIIAGLEAPDDGNILKPSNVRLGYLPQEPNQSPQASCLLECQSGSTKLFNLKSQLDSMFNDQNSRTVDPSAMEKYSNAQTQFETEGGYRLEADATVILRGLGFSKEQCEASPLSLSGGWRMRLELGKLFLNKPDFLILDEPTNHLDLPSLAWVEKYLTNFKGTLLFVSHDQELLNRLPSITLHLKNGSLTQYRGGFDSFLSEKELRESQNIKHRARLESKRKDLEQFVERFGAKATKAKQAQSKMKMIERLRALESVTDLPEEERAMAIQLPAPSPSGQVPLLVDSLEIGYSSRLAKIPKLEVERGQKIAVIGANGIGKSTLLKTLSRITPALSGDFAFNDRVNLAYFAQDQLEYLDPKASILDNLLNASDITEREARSLLGGLLFRGDDVYKLVSVLSGGEKSRVGLACILAKKSNFLLLDEPTNHLDMSSVAALSMALESYSGNLIFVSHNRTFINTICSHVLVMLPDGRAELFIGNIDHYQQSCQSRGFPNIFDASFNTDEDAKPTIEKTSKVQNRLKREAKKEYERIIRRQRKLEEELEVLTSKQKELDSKMHNTSGSEALLKLQSELDLLAVKQDALEDELLELMEKAEAKSEAMTSPSE